MLRRRRSEEEIFRTPFVLQNNNSAGPTPSVRAQQARDRNILVHVRPNGCHARGRLRQFRRCSSLASASRGSCQRRQLPAVGKKTSVPIPKFAHSCGTLRCELRNQRDTSRRVRAKTRDYAPCARCRTSGRCARGACAPTARGADRGALRTYEPGLLRLRIAMTWREDNLDHQCGKLTRLFRYSDRAQNLR